MARKKSEWDDLAQTVKKDRLRKGPECGVKALLDALSAADRPIVQTVVDDPSVQASGLARALADRLGDGAPNRSTISRHRRHECTCPREKP